MGNVQMKSQVPYPQFILCNIQRELCAIHDNNSTCDVADTGDIITLIEDYVFKLTLTPLVICCNCFVCHMFFCIS